MNKPDYLISTPENVDLHLELAGIGNRILASVIDTILSALLVVIAVAGCAMTGGLIVALAPVDDNARTALSYYVLGLSFLLILTINFGYFIFFEGLWQGQTPGKKLAGIRVIDQNGLPISWGAVFIRNLIRTIDVGLGLVGLIVMLVDKNERRAGDFAAGTLVIRERAPERRLGLLRLKAKAPFESFVDIGRLSPQEYDLLVTYLQRRGKLARKFRPEVARRLSTYFTEKLNAHDSADPPEVFLEKLYLTYQARAEESAPPLSTQESAELSRASSPYGLAAEAGAALPPDTSWHAPDRASNQPLEMQDTEPQSINTAPTNP